MLSASQTRCDVRPRPGIRDVAGRVGEQMRAAGPDAHAVASRGRCDRVVDVPLSVVALERSVGRVDERLACQNPGGQVGTGKNCLGALDPHTCGRHLHRDGGIGAVGAVRCIAHGHGLHRGDRGRSGEAGVLVRHQAVGLGRLLVLGRDALGIAEVPVDTQRSGRIARGEPERIAIEDSGAVRRRVRIPRPFDSLCADAQPVSRLELVDVSESHGADDEVILPSVTGIQNVSERSRCDGGVGLGPGLVILRIAGSRVVIGEVVAELALDQSTVFQAIQPDVICSPCRDVTAAVADSRHVAGDVDGLVRIGGSRRIDQAVGSNDRRAGHGAVGQNVEVGSVGVDRHVLESCAACHDRGTPLDQITRTVQTGLRKCFRRVADHGDDHAVPGLGRRRRSDAELHGPEVPRRRGLGDIPDLGELLAGHQNVVLVVDLERFDDAGALGRFVPVHLLDEFQIAVERPPSPDVVRRIGVPAVVPGVIVEPVETVDHVVGPSRALLFRVGMGRPWQILLRRGLPRRRADDRARQRLAQILGEEGREVVGDEVLADHRVHATMLGNDAHSLCAQSAGIAVIGRGEGGVDEATDVSRVGGSVRVEILAVERRQRLALFRRPGEVLGRDRHREQY